jgi:hypothetical protein
MSSIQASARSVRPAATVHCGVQCVANSQDPSVSAGGSGALVFSVIPALLRDGSAVELDALIVESAKRMNDPDELSCLSFGPWQPKITGRSCGPCITAKRKCVLTEGVSCAPCTKRGLICEGSRAADGPSKAGAQGQTPSAATNVPATVDLVSGSHCNSAACCLVHIVIPDTEHQPGPHGSQHANVAGGSVEEESDKTAIVFEPEFDLLSQPETTSGQPGR